MHRVIKEANSSDLNGRSYIIRVMKTGRIITWDIRHICSTQVTTEQYLLEQMKKGTRKLKDILCRQCQWSTAEHPDYTQ